MTVEPTSAKVVERVVIAKFDGDPPTADHPKEPVEVVVLERRADGTTSQTVTKKEQ